LIRGLTDTGEGETESEDDVVANGASSHWEKRMVNNEFMAAAIPMNPVRSGLTLALFEDMGWYSVNYAQAEALKWGQSKGCNFVSSRCDAWEPGYFCETAQKAGCTVCMLCIVCVCLPG
jgi:hypothetical protein